MQGLRNRAAGKKDAQELKTSSCEVHSLGEEKLQQTLLVNSGKRLVKKKDALKMLY